MDDASESAQHQTQTNTPTLSRQNSTRSARRPPHMASYGDGASEHGSGTGMHSYAANALTPGAEGGQAEDLFLNIAEDSASKNAALDAAARSDRVRVS